ncbi:hypothetical protein Kim5_CH02273 [Rhizobium sp. Kim5]|nr:hypothetical protein Kim5_CH02273 [Rhizobium sp. Kim5]
MSHAAQRSLWLRNFAPHWANTPYPRPPNEALILLSSWQICERFPSDSNNSIDYGL